MGTGQFLPQAEGYWRERMASVGRAQGRYLFLGCLVGLFYWALTSRLLHSPDAGSPAPLRLPFIAIEIDALIVWAAAPAVIGLILMAVLGTFYAMDVAAQGLTEVIGIREDLRGMYHESLDHHFNFLDAICYTVPRSPQWVKAGARLSYPLLLTTFYVEGVVLWFMVRAHHIDSPEALILRYLGGLTLLIPGYRFVRMWLTALAGFKQPPAEAP
jgi:hypothetical protein